MAGFGSRERLRPVLAFRIAEGTSTRRGVAKRIQPERLTGGIFDRKGARRRKTSMAEILDLAASRWLDKRGGGQHQVVEDDGFNGGDRRGQRRFAGRLRPSDQSCVSRELRIFP